MSQLLGMKKEKECSGYLFQVICFGIFISFVVTLTSQFFTDGLTKFMGAKDDVFTHASNYLKVSFFGYPAIVFSLIVASIMQSEGDTKSITFASVISSLVNLVLDPIFIFEKISILNINGLNLGVIGASLATVISQYIMLLTGIFLLKKNKRKIKVRFKGEKLSLEKIKKIFKIAIPSMVGQSSEAFGFVILNKYISYYGTITLAAYSLVNRTTSILMQPPMGIGMSLPTIIGQNLGAGKLKRVKESFKSAHLISFVISFIGAVIMLIFSKEIIEIFVKKEEAKIIFPEAYEYMLYSIPIMPLMGCFSIFNGFFLGTGHTKYSMIMGIGRLWLIRIPIIILIRTF